MLAAASGSETASSLRSINQIAASSAAQFLHTKRSMQTCSDGQVNTYKCPSFRTTAVIQASAAGPNVGRPMEHLTGAELAARELHPTISGGSAIR